MRKMNHRILCGRKRKKKKNERGRVWMIDRGAWIIVKDVDLLRMKFNLGFELNLCSINKNIDLFCFRGKNTLLVKPILIYLLIDSDLVSKNVHSIQFRWFDSASDARSLFYIKSEIACYMHCVYTQWESDSGKWSSCMCRLQ